jgi:LacI family transcriptional regulator
MSTIREIARVADVSTATVFRVINFPDVVRVETRERVQRAVKLCRCKYNALARGFVTRQTVTLGPLTPTVSTPFSAKSIGETRDYAGDLDYQVILADGDR